MEKMTIQRIAVILYENDLSFEPLQPKILDGEFVAQYRVGNGRVDRIYTAQEVQELAECF